MYISEKPIQPTNIYAGCIAEYENIWDEEKTKKYIEDIESAIDDRESGIIFNKAVSFNHGDPNNLYYNEHRTNYNLGLTDSAKVNESFRIIHNDFYLKSIAALSSYCSIFDIKEEIKFVEQINLLRYQGGQRYDAHYDGGTTSGRSVSPILYINEDYSGGELEFVNFNLKIKPKSGSLYLFPSNYAYRHIAHPVTSGTKYAIVTWLHD